MIAAAPPTYLRLHLRSAHNAQRPTPLISTGAGSGTFAVPFRKTPEADWKVTPGGRFSWTEAVWEKSSATPPLAKRFSRAWIPAEGLAPLTGNAPP